MHDLAKPAGCFESSVMMQQATPSVGQEQAVRGQILCDGSKDMHLAIFILISCTDLHLGSRRHLYIDGVSRLGLVGWRNMRRPPEGRTRSGLAA